MSSRYFGYMPCASRFFYSRSLIWSRLEGNVRMCMSDKTVVGCFSVPFLAERWTKYMLIEFSYMEISDPFFPRRSYAFRLVSLELKHGQVACKLQ